VVACALLLAFELAHITKFIVTARSLQKRANAGTPGGAIGAERAAAADERVPGRDGAVPGH
jgi:hypothetical protein